MKIYAAVLDIQIIGHICKHARGLHNIDLIEMPMQIRTFYANTKGVPKYTNSM